MKRIKTAKAAEILGVTGETVRAYAREGWITRLPSEGNFYFDQAEVEAFAAGGKMGSKAYRETNGMTAKAAKRGRRQKV